MVLGVEEPDEAQPEIDSTVGKTELSRWGRHAHIESSLAQKFKKKRLTAAVSRFFRAFEIIAIS